jgi:hypothetical protein
MPFNESMPWFTSFLWILGIFAVATLIFHTLFIWGWKLSPVNWKRVDYFWLSMALIGLLSTVGTGRELVAKNLLEMERSRLTSLYEHMRYQARTALSQPLCFAAEHPSTFEASEVARQQASEFGSQCAWFKKVSAVLDASDRPQKLAADGFGPFPAGGDQTAHAQFMETVGILNLEADRVDSLAAEGRSKDFENFVRLFGPVLIAIALALRITKVTAEVKAELDKSPGPRGRPTCPAAILPE